MNTPEPIKEEGMTIKQAQNLLLERKISADDYSRLLAKLMPRKDSVSPNSK